MYINISIQHKIHNVFKIKKLAFSIYSVLKYIYVISEFRIQFIDIPIK